VLTHLDDVASDLSVFHRIRDIRGLRSTAFLRLAMRLAAYNGAVAARMAAERRESAPKSRTRTVTAPRYEGRPPRYTPRNADSAPPATAASLLALNTELGAQWFSVRTVKAGEAAQAGGEDR
jgi:hypothetical protein